MPPRVNLDSLCDCLCESCNLLHYMCKCDLMEQIASIRDNQDEDLDDLIVVESNNNDELIQIVVGAEEPEMDRKFDMSSQEVDSKCYRITTIFYNLILIALFTILLIVKLFRVYYDYTINSKVSFFQLNLVFLLMFNLVSFGLDLKNCFKKA